MVGCFTDSDGDFPFLRKCNLDYMARKKEQSEAAWFMIGEVSNGKETSGRRKLPPF